MNASLRFKLTAFAVVSVLAFITILLLNYYSNIKSSEARHATEFVSDQLHALSKSVSLEKTYLSKPTNELEAELIEVVNKIQIDLQAQQATLLAIGVDAQQLTVALNNIANYQQGFKALAEQQKVIGLHPKDAAYGALRKSVHEVEELIKGASDYELLAAMLQLRRAEKDFMLRFDKKYLIKFDKLIESFLRHLASSQSTINKALVREKIMTYQQRFTLLVSSEEKKGLSEEQGLRRELKYQTAVALGSLNELMKDIQAKNESALTQIRYTIFTIGAGISLLLIFLSWITVQSVTKRATSLQRQIAEIESTKDLTCRIDAKNGDEFADIAVNINSFVESIHNVLLRVTRSTSMLDQTTTVINDNATKANQGSEQQMQETTDIAQAIKEMSGTINELSQNTDDTSTDAVQTAALAKSGMSQLMQVANDVSELANMLNQAESKTSTLQQQSEQVSSVLSVIDTIAEQTNLLALNAAIEAARAGEHGRGFAVVADEVRQLAMKTQESTVSISNIISSLKDEISSIVGVIQLSAKNGETVSVSTKEVNVSLNQIVDKIDSVSEKNANIATAIEQQGYVAAEISRSVVGISQVAKEASERTKDNQSISRMLNQESESLNAMLAEFELGES